MLYEINYLVLQSKTSDLEKIRAEMKKFIESFDAKITAEREYLKRKLSYEINHERYGFFTVLRFEIKDKDQIQELKKNLNIDENVCRYIIVQASELPSLEEQAKIESDIQRKDTLKQEEIEQALAEESKKTSQTETKKEEEKETAPVEEEKNPPTDKEDTEEDDNNKKVEEESSSASSSVKATADKEEKVEDVKQEEKEEKPKKEAEEKEEEEKDDDSLDELDKKLDEILNL